VGILMERGDALAWPLLAAAAAVAGTYAVAIVAFTPRDWWHALPAAIAVACYAAAWLCA
jgi:branched-subunit amino acid ABC-type transport system permease component